MAIKTLALVYDTGTGRVTQSGLADNVMPDVVAKILSTMGVVFEPHANEGRLLDKGNFGAKKRATVIARFNAKFDAIPNPLAKVDSTTAINEDPFAAADVTLTVDDGTQFAQYDYIKIDDEILYISAINTNNLTVTRAYGGTVDAAHADDTAVYIVSRCVLTLTSV